MKEVNMMPHLRSLATTLDKIVRDGFTDDFQVHGQYMRSLGSGKTYPPEEIRIVTFFRFEGYADAADNSILYVIETHDGIKGTLIDSYGEYSNIQVKTFIDRVEQMQKRVAS